MWNSSIELCRVTASGGPCAVAMCTAGSAARHRHLPHIIRALRPVHWTKNLLLFSTLFIGGDSFSFNSTVFSQALIGFIAFSLAHRPPISSTTCWTWRQIDSIRPNEPAFCRRSLARDLGAAVSGAVAWSGAIGGARLLKDSSSVCCCMCSQPACIRPGSNDCLSSTSQHSRHLFAAACGRRICNRHSRVQMASGGVHAVVPFSCLGKALLGIAKTDRRKEKLDARPGIRYRRSRPA